MRGHLGRGAVGEARSPRARSAPRGRSGAPRSLGSERLAAARVGPCEASERDARLARELERVALARRRRPRRGARGVRPGAARPRPRRPWLGQMLGEGRPRPRAASSSSKASTAARSPTPKGASRSRMSSGASRPERVAARTSPERRRSVSRATRSRISSSATTIAACCTQSRSKSPSSPERRTTTSQASADPARGETGCARARPRRSGWLGTKGAAARCRAAGPRRERRRAGTRGAGDRRWPAPRRGRPAPPSCRRPRPRSRGRPRRGRRPAGRAARAAR